MYTKYKIFILILIIQSTLFSCTIFDTKSSRDEVLVGRNFDYSKNSGQINFIPSTNNSYGVVLLSLDNPNMPYEGMNDRGLVVAILAVPNTQTTLNLLKPIRKSLEMVKVILQKASNIDEAVEQFDRYSIAFGQFLGNPLIHFKIVQKDGDSAVVEFVNNKKVIIRGNESKILTNHYLSDTSIKADSNSSLARFNIIKNSLKKSSSVQDVFEILKKCKQKDTLWSTLYNLTKQEIYLSYKDGKIVKFNLKDELYKNREPFFYSMQNLKEKKSLVNTISTLQIRPHFGYGNQNTTHYGTRILLNSSDTQAYGLEVTEFKTKDDDFLAIGIVLEQRLWEWFGMSIGTIGYFDHKDQNSVGLVSNLGWEPNNHIPFRPFITYRNDIIFAKDKIDTLQSISAGFKFEF
jgi:penicillin V acylase-like amidase (Ntn superfamily)